MILLCRHGYHCPRRQDQAEISIYLKLRSNFRKDNENGLGKNVFLARSCLSAVKLNQVANCFIDFSHSVSVTESGPGLVMEKAILQEAPSLSPSSAAKSPGLMLV